MKIKNILLLLALLFTFCTSFASSIDKNISTAETIEGVPSSGRFINCEPLFKPKVGCNSFINRCYDRYCEQLVIVKSMTKSEAHNISNEIRIFELIRKFELVNTIQILDVVDEGGSTFLILKYANGGDWFTFIQKNKLPLNNVRILFQIAMLAIEELHDNNIAHLDIKPDNFFIMEEKGGLKFLKIADFGFSEYLPRGAKPSFNMKGSPAFMAPEVYNVEEIAKFYKSEREYDPFKADIYSAGVMLYYALTGEYPYSAPSPRSERFVYFTKHGLKKLIIYNNHQNKFNQDAINLLKKMMNLKHHKRPSAQEVLNDTWLADLE